MRLQTFLKLLAVVCLACLGSHHVVAGEGCRHHAHHAYGPAPVYSAPTYAPMVYSVPRAHLPTYSQSIVHDPLVAAPLVSKPAARSERAVAANETRQVSQREYNPTPVASVAEGRKAFLARNLGAALKIADELVTANPQDSDKLQFRSLLHMASGNYKASAADAYDAALQGRLWTREVLQTLYENPSKYMRDMTMLRLSVVQSSQDKQALTPMLFLLAYHEAIGKNYAASRDALNQMLKLRPQDRVARGLLSVVEAKLKEVKDT